jgi:hypothetical protein
LLLANAHEIDPEYVDDGTPPPWMQKTWQKTVVLDRSAHPYRSR